VSGVTVTHPSPGPPTTSSCARGTLNQAIAALRRGRFVLIADGPGPECEADLTLAADHVTPEKINFMVTHGGGIIYLCLPERRCWELGLTPMRPGADPARWESALTVSIEARDGISTGISAHDRAHTVRVAADPRCDPHDLVRPGHVFPVAARSGGVQERAGRTEASVDLSRLADLTPATVDCELVTTTTAAARGEDLARFAARHRIPLITVADVVAHRTSH